MFAEDELDQDTLQQILQTRARLLAQSPQAADSVQGIGYVALQLGKEKYGVAIQYVQEIRVVGHLTRVPSTPAFYAGLVNLRGHLYPVLDLQRYLGLPEEKNSPKSKLVLVAALGLEICILADAVLGIQWVTDAEIQTLLTDSASQPRSVIRGVTADLLSILDVEGLLADSKLIVQDEIL